MNRAFGTGLGAAARNVAGPDESTAAGRRRRHDPGMIFDLPVDLLAVLGAQELERLPHSAQHRWPASHR